MKLIKKIIPLGTAILPFTALAAVTELGSRLEDILNDIINILNILLPLLLALGVIVFLWGIVKYITAAGDEEKIKEAKKYIVWGLIFLAIMVALWGFVALINNLFGVSPGGSPPGPDFPS
jgi:tellurite resistance protein TehA-like permease